MNKSSAKESNISDITVETKYKAKSSECNYWKLRYELYKQYREGK